MKKYYTLILLPLSLSSFGQEKFDTNSIKKNTPSTISNRMPDPTVWKRNKVEIPNNRVAKNPNSIFQNLYKILLEEGKGAFIDGLIKELGETKSIVGKGAKFAPSIIKLGGIFYSLYQAYNVGGKNEKSQNRFDGKRL